MNTTCIVCHKPIKVMAFRGSDFCSDDCRKKSGADIKAEGTMMFVTPEEAAQIKRRREFRSGVVIR